jgi:hypothetical protein
MAPSREEIAAGSDESVRWAGRTFAALDRWRPGMSAPARTHLAHIQSHSRSIDPTVAYTALLTAIHEASADLRMETVGPISTAVGAGGAFDYFDEIRQLLETASKDLLFVDPYLDADFVSTYLPQVKAGVSVRLLTKAYLPSLVPAVAKFAQQGGLGIQIRSDSTIHDRYIIVDGTACYQSGASFKDGGKAPTTITQITDAFAAVRDTYERLWAAAKVERQED